MRSLYPFLFKKIILIYCQIHGQSGTINLFTFKHTYMPLNKIKEIIGGKNAPKKGGLFSSAKKKILGTTALGIVSCLGAGCSTTTIIGTTPDGKITTQRNSSFLGQKMEDSTTTSNSLSPTINKSQTNISNYNSNRHEIDASGEGATTSFPLDMTPTKHIMNENDAEFSLSGDLSYPSSLVEGAKVTVTKDPKTNESKLTITLQYNPEYADTFKEAWVSPAEFLSADAEISGGNVTLGKPVMKNNSITFSFGLDFMDSPRGNTVEDGFAVDFMNGTHPSFGETPMTKNCISGHFKITKKS